MEAFPPIFSIYIWEKKQNKIVRPFLESDTTAERLLGRRTSPEGLAVLLVCTSNALFCNSSGRWWNWHQPQDPWTADAYDDISSTNSKLQF